ncbi:MAG: RNA methyltransferase [Bacteriovoracaceae bacterium]|jgi:hypothetical protein|nr:hypothetical protein [Halobacteriovoraceae bacterium]MDP7319213.1 RNA methyltransferase [Bacteriovoracaceae bacterium]
MNLYLGLIHHPVLGRKDEIITTSVTNLDIHDIARTARTFGFKQYFIVTPVKKQHDLVRSILDHWNTDEENSYNPDRSSALSFIELADSIEVAKSRIEEIEGMAPYIVVTGANFKEFSGTEKDLCAKLQVDKRPIFLLFGTGWGLHASVTDHADFKLDPIIGTAKDGYNHLSVRSAVAIYCDRISRSL